MGWFNASSLTFEDLVLYFLGMDYAGLPTVHMWFMYALIAMYLIFPLFKKLYDEGARSLVIYGCGTMLFFSVVITDADLLFLAIGSVFPSLDINLGATVSNLYNPFSAWTLGFYFFLGPFLYELTEKYQSRYSLKKLLVGCIILFVIGFSLNYLAQYIYTGTFRWVGITLESQYLHVGTLIMGSTFFAFFCFLPWQNKKLNHAMEFFSANTITVYYAHMIFMYASTFVIFYPLGLAEAGVWLVVLRAVVVVLMGSVLGWAMKKVPLLKRVA